MKSSKVRAKNLLSIELAVNQFHHEAPVGVSFEDVLVPQYWEAFERSMQIGNRIEVRAADGSWWAMLIVSDSPPSLKVQPLQHVELEATSSTISGHDDYEIVSNGSTWSVAFKPDGALLKSGFNSIKDAQIWWGQHVNDCRGNGRELWDIGACA